MKRRDEVLVGVLTTVALIVGILGAIWLARGGLSNGYPLYAKFPWGAGLKQGQPVLLVGVTVGYVDRVELKYDGTLVTSFRIQNQYRVPQGTLATAVANGIFGDMAIALTPVAPNPRSIPPGDTVPTGPPQPGIANLTARFDTIGSSVKAITDAAERQLVDSGGIEDLRETLAATNRLVVQLGQVVALQSRELAATMALVRRSAAAIDSAQVDSTVRDLRATSANVAQLSESFKSTNARLDSLLAKVENGDGTAARLLNDPGLYNDVRSLVGRLDSLSADFKKNPRRYVNLRVF